MPKTAVVGQVDIKKGVADPFDQHPARQVVDFLADAPYLVDFSDPAVFGVASASLKTGHNHLHVQVETGRTEYRLRPPVAAAILVEKDVTKASVGCGGAAMVTESAAAFSTTAAFGPTGNILVP